MKRLAILLSGAALLAGCSKENKGGDAPQGKFTISASQTSARNILDENNVVKWAETDLLGVVKADGTTHIKFFTKASDITAGGLKAKFTGDAPETGTHIAYYPYQASAPVSQANALSLEGQRQDGTATGHLGAYDFLTSDPVTIGDGQTDADFVFSHRLSLVQLGFYLKDAAAEVKITGVTLYATDNDANEIDAFATGVYFDPSTGEMKASGKSSKALLTVANSPDLGTDAAKPFVTNQLVFNQSGIYPHHPYNIAVVVTTNQGAVTIPNVKTISSPADEFAPGKRYAKTLKVAFPSADLEIPDANFRAYLGTLGFIFTGTDNRFININNPDNLTLLHLITEIDCSFRSIADLTGIEYFQKLTTLRCSNNQLVSLDVSDNTTLTELRCQDNKLASLNVSNNTALARLHCQSNQLVSLDVSKNTVLTELRCQSNQLASLDVSKNTALATLYCYDNRLTSLDLPESTALTYLYCNDNRLTSLDVSKSTGLADLNCDNNQLISLDVSKSTALTELYCHGNRLSQLDITPLSSLIFLSSGEQTTGDMTLYLTQAQFDGKWTSSWKHEYNTGVVTSVK